MSLPNLYSQEELNELHANFKITTYMKSIEEIIRNNDEVVLKLYSTHSPKNTRDITLSISKKSTYIDVLMKFNTREDGQQSEELSLPYSKDYKLYTDLLEHSITKYLPFKYKLCHYRILSPEPKVIAFEERLVKALQQSSTIHIIETPTGLSLGSKPNRLYIFDSKTYTLKMAPLDDPFKIKAIFQVESILLKSESVWTPLDYLKYFLEPFHRMELLSIVNPETQQTY